MSAADLVTNGSVLLAAPVAAAAGLMSFLSPCVLPLVPGYLSFVTGLSGEELEERERRDALPEPAEPVLVGAVSAGGAVLPANPGLAGRREPGPRARLRQLRWGGRVTAGTGLFVLGFTAVFVSYGAAFGGLGNRLLAHQVGVNQILGAFTVVMGLAFAGLFSQLSWANREWRFHRLPRPGLIGAPLLGVMFGVGWAPCIGPTLTAVLGLATTSATAGRGAFLSAVYCFGLGAPFLAVGLAFRRAAGALLLLRRHSRILTVSGGLLLVAVGMLQLTGAWADLIIFLRPYAPGFSETPL
ncbi:cytochrome c biogenesis protein CcdA [Frankia sp. Ag45/Mut15]|uniref:Cytochrome c biogenesis protein CcdA n=1 Tax=Frankia umida TaxID=573489 RepID=A0ABT0JT72_9ACTN|nr:cytochrome c biogenesis protein CcdA [Frankia umida]MCK9874772.1 cytochrome c biogenesis protein CcdA [Frankia umida]